VLLNLRKDNKSERQGERDKGCLEIAFITGGGGKNCCSESSQAMPARPYGKGGWRRGRAFGGKEGKASAVV